MAIPPPPPPNAPPPPGPPIMKAGPPPKAANPNDRNKLLESIQKGTKLKKTTTVDKSKPFIDSPSKGRAPSGPPMGGIGGGSSNGGGMASAPKLGGLFEGVGMPKLKPVDGSRPGRGGGAGNVPANRSPPTENSYKSSNGGGAAGPPDMKQELSNLFRNKQNQQQGSSNSTSTSPSIRPSFKNNESISHTDRGPPRPPPQQPPQSPPQKPHNNTGNAYVDSTNNSSYNSSNTANGPTLKKFNPPISNSGNPTKPSYPLMTPTTATNTNSTSAISQQAVLGNLFNVLPNKSSLFTNSNSASIQSTITTSSQSSLSSTSVSSYNNNINSSSNNINNNSNSSIMQQQQQQQQFNKPVPNYGKPNLAPKPPGMQSLQLSLALPSSQPAAPGKNVNGRPTVARHHSMKTPRPPPAAPPLSTLPATPPYGTMKPQKPSQGSSNDISIGGNVRINPVSNRPMGPPPKPPSVKPAPPQTPVRSVSTSNLTTIPISVPPNNVHLSVNDNNSPLNNNFGSENNVAKMRGGVENNANVSNNNNSDNNNESNFSNNNGNQNLSKSINMNHSSIHNNNINHNKDVAPPLPPHRTCPAPPPPINQHACQPKVPTRGSSLPKTRTNMDKENMVTKVIQDLESKFSNDFHKVTEFPAPQVFLNLPKNYASQNGTAKQLANAEIRKQRAPNPPSNQHGFLQLTDKLFANDSSSC